MAAGAINEQVKTMITQNTPMNKTERDAALYRAWMAFLAARYEVECGDAPEEYQGEAWEAYLNAVDAINAAYSAAREAAR